MRLEMPKICACQQPDTATSVEAGDPTAYLAST